MGKRVLRNLGFLEEKVTAEQVAMLNKVEEELPSVSDVDKAGDIELQEIVKSTENFISQMSQTENSFKGEEMLPMRELLGLDKQLRSIRGSLKVEATKKVQLEENIKKEHRKLEEFLDYPGVYDSAMREDVMKRINALNN